MCKNYFSGRGKNLFRLNGGMSGAKLFHGEEIVVRPESKHPVAKANLPQLFVRQMEAFRRKLTRSQHLKKDVMKQTSAFIAAGLNRHLAACAIPRVANLRGQDSIRRQTVERAVDVVAKDGSLNAASRLDLVAVAFAVLKDVVNHGTTDLAAADTAAETTTPNASRSTLDLFADRLAPLVDHDAA